MASAGMNGALLWRRARVQVSNNDRFVPPSSQTSVKWPACTNNGSFASGCQKKNQNQSQNQGAQSQEGLRSLERCGWRQPSAYRALPDVPADPAGQCGQVEC